AGGNGAGGAALIVPAGPLFPLMGAKVVGPALLVNLTGTADTESIWGNIPGNDRAGGNIGAVADLHRRDERRIGTDEGAVADFGLELVDAIVIAGDGAGTDIRVRA